jgi:hypothetical protein
MSAVIDRAAIERQLRQETNGAFDAKVACRYPHQDIVGVANGYTC